MSRLLTRLRAASTNRRVLVGAAIVLALVGVRFVLAGGGSPTHRITAMFRNAGGLVSGNEVRVAGVEAGSVERVSVAYDRGQTSLSRSAQLASDLVCVDNTTPIDNRPRTPYCAEAQLTVSDAAWQRLQGQRVVVSVRPKGVLSNVDVDIEQDPAGIVLTDGATLRVTQTGSPVNLDELQSVFSKPVTDSIRTSITQGVAALYDGSGAINGTEAAPPQNGAASLNGLLGNLTPLTADLQPITAVLAARSPELDRLNGEFATVSGELAAENASIRDILAEGKQFFGVITAKQQDLQGTLDNGTKVFTELDGILGGEEQNLITTFSKLPNVLATTTTTGGYLNPLVANVNPHIPDLNILLHELVTATGYIAPSGVSSLRVDASLPNSATRGAVACGGEPSEQKGCPYSPQVASSSSGTSGQATTAAAPAASAPTPFLGGLIG